MDSEYCSFGQQQKNAWKIASGTKRHFKESKPCLRFHALTTNEKLYIYWYLMGVDERDQMPRVLC